MKNVVEKWAATGLLQEMDAESASKLAVSLDELSAVLIMNAQSVSENPSLLNYTLFPVARLLANKGCFPEAQTFYVEYKEWLSKNTPDHLTLDDEAALCRRFADEYAARA